MIQPKLSSRGGLLAAGLLLCTAAARVQDEVEDAASTFTFPEGPVAELARNLGERVDPAPAPEGWPPFPDDAAWTERETWSRWVELLRSASDADRSNAERRASLAMLAAAQGRSLDAWDHWRACADVPAVAAAVLPTLLPGAPAGHPAIAGGLPAPLPDGVTLRPVLPPPSADAIPGWVDRREMKVRGVAIGAAVLAIRVALEPDGIQVDVEHLSGGTARVRVVLPVPEGLTIRFAYADWIKQADFASGLTLEVHPGDETHTFWGRFYPDPVDWPTRLPERPPVALETAGVRILATADDPRAPLLAELAWALGEVLGVPSELSTDPVPRPADAIAPLAIDLRIGSVRRWDDPLEEPDEAASPAAERDRKLVGILSLAERYLLQ